MDAEQKRMIHLIAEDVADLYNVQIPERNIHAVVHQMGGEIILADKQMDNEYIQKSCYGFRIIMHPQKDWRRFLFQTARQIGHLFLHMGYQTNLSIWNSYKPDIPFMSKTAEQEFHANEFASAFLMPEHKFKSVAEMHCTDGNVDTKKVAEYFGVTVSAASMRGKSLGIFQ